MKLAPGIPAPLHTTVLASSFHFLTLNWPIYGFMGDQRRCGDVQKHSSAILLENIFLKIQLSFIMVADRTNSAGTDQSQADF